MNIGRKLTLLTFVLVSSGSSELLGAPDTKATEIIETNSDGTRPPEAIQQMDISPVPETPIDPLSLPTRSIYFPYESSISPRFGGGSDLDKLSKNEYYYFFGINYQLPSSDGVHWEPGADVFDDGTGVISWGRKWRMTPTESLRPYFKLGAGLMLVPSEQLNTFLRTENYQIRPSLGFEHFLAQSSSFRLDMETWVSLKKIGFHLGLGYSYAW